MSSIDTMTLLADSFIGIAERRPLEKVSVSDIVAASGKNRKTFYYHFEGKEHLVRWIFRRDLAEVLLDTVDEQHLVYEKGKEGAMPDLPFYVFKKTGVRSLDGSVFLHALAACFQSRRRYYAKALKVTGPESLQSYFRALYSPALEADIRFILSNRYLAETNVKFLAEFYTGALLAYLVEKVCDLTCENVLAQVKPFDNIVHSSLEYEIKAQQLRRVL